jgi:hypothetical protein
MLLQLRLYKFQNTGRNACATKELRALGGSCSFQIYSPQSAKAEA